MDIVKGVWSLPQIIFDRVYIILRLCKIVVTHTGAYPPELFAMCGIARAMSNTGTVSTVLTDPDTDEVINPQETVEETAAQMGDCVRVTITFEVDISK